MSHAPEPEHAYVDEHRVRVAASREQVWLALEHWAWSLCASEHGLLGRVLGTEPAAGFAVTEASPPERLTLTGRHRFSRYALVFALDPAGDGATWLRALTYADFPGLRGRAYRGLVIGGGLHVLATRRMLDQVARRAVSPGPR